MASSRSDVAKVPLPLGVRAATMVGRGGHNVKWLHFNSGGAHITVNDTGIIVRAKDGLVRGRAEQLVRRQLDAALKLGSHECPSPTRVDFVLLECAFGANPRVRFSQRNDAVARAASPKDKLFQLVPEPICRGNAVVVAGLSALPLTSEVLVRTGSLSDSVVASIDGGASSASQRDQDEERDQDLDLSRQLSSDCSDTSSRFHAALGGGKCTTAQQLLAPAGRALEEAVNLAARRELRFDIIKIRFKLGNNMFRNLGPRVGKAALSVAELEGVGTGKGMYQSTFGNYVPDSTVPLVTSWLTERLGFSLVDTKTTATVHVINQELNVHYSIALVMERGDDATATLRKLKTGGSKSHSVTLMGRPDQLDLQLKLITQYREHPALVHDLDAHTTAKRVAAAVRAEGFDGFTRSKRGLPRNRHLEYARRKSKFIYEGRFHSGNGSSHRMRISVTQVQDDRGTHFEISGCLPDLDSKLRPPQPPVQSWTPSFRRASDSPVQPWVPSFQRASDGPDWRRPAGHSDGGAGPGWRRPAGHSDSGAGPEVSCCSAACPLEPEWAVRALGALSAFVVDLNAHVGGAREPSLEATF